MSLEESKKGRREGGNYAGANHHIDMEGDRCASSNEFSNSHLSNQIDHNPSPKHSRVIPYTSSSRIRFVYSYPKVFIQPSHHIVSHTLIVHPGLHSSSNPTPAHPFPRSRYIVQLLSRP